MLYSKSSVLPENIPTIKTVQGIALELVTSYKYLGLIIDGELSFKAHIKYLVSKLRVKLVFYYRNKACFPPKARKFLISATFMPVLDYCDVVYMCASTSCLQSLTPVYHSALRFITGCSRLTHHCELYAEVGLPSLSERRFTHWMTLVYKALLGLVPAYLCCFLQSIKSRYALRSNNILHLAVPRVWTEMGKKAFSFSAPSAWNTLQSELKMSELDSLEAFRSFLKDRLQKSFQQCLCF